MDSLKNAWTHIPCMRKFVGLKSEEERSSSIFKTRFHAIYSWSRSQQQPLRIVPDPYHLTQTTSVGSSVREHDCLGTSAQSDCLLVGDHIASSSLDASQNYMIISAFRFDESLEKFIDECFKVGGSDDIYALSVDISCCPSWRQLLIKDGFFELDFDGCGNSEIFKIEEVEFLSHTHIILHFKCSQHHHKSFLKWFDLVSSTKSDIKAAKDRATRDKLELEFIQTSLEKYGDFKNLKLTLNSFFFLRPFTCKNLGRFHASFQYLLEICYLFCHIIAKGLLERHDHYKCQGQTSVHAFDSPVFKYHDYDGFLLHEGCFLIHATVSRFLQQADDRRMRLLDFMPYGLQFRNDPTYKSCLSLANQVHDLLFLLKESFKILSPLHTHGDSHGEGNPLRLWFPRDPSPYQSGINCQTLSARHNQQCFHRCIHRFVSKDINQEVFDSFEMFIDPFFASSQSQIHGSSRDLRRLFCNMTRSIHSLDLGQVFSFSSGLLFHYMFQFIL